MKKLLSHFWEKRGADGRTNRHTDRRADRQRWFYRTLRSTGVQQKSVTGKSVYKEVTVETTPGWLEISLKNARIDTKTYEVHSLRTVSQSKTSMEELNVPVVLATGRWGRELILVKLYKKNIIAYSPVPSRYLIFLPIQFILHETYFMVF